MPLSFQDAVAIDAQRSVLDPNVFARSVTLVKPAAALGGMTQGQRLALGGVELMPDGALSEFDLLQLGGAYRIGEQLSGDSTSSTITVQWIRDGEDDGQGLGLDTDNDRRTIKHARIVVAESTAITLEDLPDKCDAVVVDGERWSCLRVETRDTLQRTKTIVVRRDDKTTTKHGRKRPT